MERRNFGSLQLLKDTTFLPEHGNSNNTTTSINSAFDLLES